MTIKKYLYALYLTAFLLFSPDSWALTPFQPSGDTQAISASSSSSGVTLGIQGDQYMVQNAGTVTVFIKTGSNSATAVAATGTPVLAGAILVLSKPTSHQYIAAITASGTATVYVTPGSGE